MLEDTLDHAQMLARHFGRDNLKYVANAVLFELKVPTDKAAFDYMLNAIVVSFADPITPAIKGLYSTVGEMYNPAVGTNAMEQAIRAAIQVAWRERDEKIWSYYFQPDGKGLFHKPTNMEFIRGVMRFLILWEGFCGEVDKRGK